MTPRPERRDAAPDAAERRAQEERLLAVWASPKGLAYWSAVNNTEVGVWYTCGTFLFFLGAGVLALLMRYQLAVPSHDRAPIVAVTRHLPGGSGAPRRRRASG